MDNMQFSRSLNSKRQANLNALANRLHCTMTQRPNMPGMMYVEFGYVEGPIVETQIHYLTMLHELGHVARCHTQGRPPRNIDVWYFENGVLRSEAEAWDWALNHCDDEEIEDASRDFMWNVCLKSYYNEAVASNGTYSRLWNGDRHYVQFIYDKPDEFFINTVKRITGSDMGIRIGVLR